MDQILSSALLVVATMIATFTYNVGTTPPGGSWQVDPNSAPMPAGPQPGAATFTATKDLETAYTMLLYSTITFSVCLTALIFGFPFRNMGYISQFLVVLIQAAVFFTVGIYGESIEWIYSPLDRKIFHTIIKYYNVYWGGVIGVWCFIRLFLIGVWLRHLIHVPPPPSLEMIAFEDVHVQIENEIH